MVGRLCAHGWAASICVLSASSVASSHGLPTSCTDSAARRRPVPRHDERRLARDIEHLIEGDSRRSRGQRSDGSATLEGSANRDGPAAVAGVTTTSTLLISFGARGRGRFRARTADIRLGEINPPSRPMARYAPPRLGRGIEWTLS